MTGILTALEMENLKIEIIGLSERLQSFYKSMEDAARSYFITTKNKLLKKERKKADKKTWLSRKKLKTTILSKLLKLSQLLPDEYPSPSSGIESKNLSYSEVTKTASKLKLLPKHSETISVAGEDLAISWPLYPKESIQEEEPTPTLVTQTAMASKDLLEDTRKITHAKEWAGAGILHDAISKPWFPKEFIPEGEPTVHGVYKGLSK